MHKIEQEIFIWRYEGEYNNRIIKTDEAIYDEDTGEFYSLHRDSVLHKLNSMGYRVVQFLYSNDSALIGEEILVEKVY